MSSDYPDSATAAQPAAGEVDPAAASTPWVGYEQFRPRPKSERTPPRGWLVAVVIAWGAMLATGIGWAVANGEPTSRDQTTVAEALPVVDRAAVDIVAAVAADGQGVAAIADLAKATDCSISVVRPGERYQRVVNAFVTPGTEQALLTRVADRLPSSYRAAVRVGNNPRLTADAGLYVAINATVTAPGTVRFVVDTGDCRPPGEIPAPATVAPPPALRDAADTALGWLGLSAGNWHTYAASCGDGRTLVTVEGQSSQAAAGPIDTPLRVTSSSSVVSTPTLVAYANTEIGVVARTVNQTVVVTATGPCR